MLHGQIGKGLPELAAVLNKGYELLNIYGLFALAFYPSVDKLDIRSK